MLSSAVSRRSTTPGASTTLEGLDTLSEIDESNVATTLSEMDGGRFILNYPKKKGYCDVTLYPGDIFL